MPVRNIRDLTRQSWTRRIMAALTLTVMTMTTAVLFNAAPAAAFPPGTWLETFVVSDDQPGYPYHRCLDVDAGTEANARTNVQLYNCRDKSDALSGYQRWEQISIQGRPSSEFKIRNQRTQKCLTYNPAAESRSPVWAESCNRDGQGWTMNDEWPDSIQAVQAWRKCLDIVDYLHAGNRTGIDMYGCGYNHDYTNWYFIAP
jgi:hypothetical protein